jgi:DNA-binding NarL/FixJ family response regulator
MPRLHPPASIGIRRVEPIRPAPDSHFLCNSQPVREIAWLLKRSSPEELIEAVKQAVSGGAPMSPQIARQVVNFFYHEPTVQPGHSLSPREQEVIELLADGFLYKEIAERLNLTFETVRTYVKLIYEKLQAHSRMDAVTKWRSLGARHRPMK